MPTNRWRARSTEYTLSTDDLINQPSFAVNNDDSTTVFTRDTGNIDHGVNDALFRAAREETMSMWKFNNLAERTSRNHAAEVVAGRVNDYAGEAALTYELIRGAQERISDRIEGGAQPARAFNRTAGGWNRSLKARLAAHESLEERGDDTYQEETRHFAAAAGMFDEDGEVIELPNSDYSPSIIYPENPYDSGRCTEQEADTIMAIRFEGLDEAEIAISEIRDHEQFRNWLGEVSNIQQAFDLHLLNTNFPREIASEVRPVGDWQELDPTDINQGHCCWCGAMCAEIEVLDGGVEIVDQTGRRGGKMFGVEEGEWFVMPGRDRFLCFDCHEDFRGQEASRFGVLVADEATIMLASIGRGIIRDVSFSDETFDRYSDALEDLRHSLLSRMNAAPVEDHTDFFTVTGRGPTSRLNEIVVANAHELESTPVMFTWRQGREPRGHFPNDPEAAREVKELLDQEHEPTLEEATEQQDEDSLRTISGRIMANDV